MLRGVDHRGRALGSHGGMSNKEVALPHGLERSLLARKRLDGWDSQRLKQGDHRGGWELMVA